MATAINTNVGQRESLRTSQATNFNTVTAAQTPVSTSSKELADALGIITPAFASFATGFMKDKDAKARIAASAEYNNLSNVDKALVIGHPSYADKSFAFRDKLREMRTDTSLLNDHAVIEKGIRTGELNTTDKIKAKSDELRALSLGDQANPDNTEQYDAGNKTALTKYGMVGAVIEGDSQLKEARVQSQQIINAAFQEGGYEGAVAAFKASVDATNYSNSDLNTVMMEALSSAIEAPDANPISSLKLLQEMRDRKITGADGKVLGSFGAISGFGDKLTAMETGVMTRGTKAATLQISNLTIDLTRLANTGDVAGTTSAMMQLTNNPNPVIAEWAKGQVDNFVLKADSVNAANVVTANTELLAAQTQQVSTQVAYADLAAVMNNTNSIGSTLMQPATQDVTVIGKGGKLITKTITVSAEERLRNVKQLAIETSDAQHKANPDESNADWFLRDYKTWGVHGMVPPHHAAMAKQGVSSLRMVGETNEPMSPTGMQTLRQFQLLQNNASAAKELYGAEYEYLSQVDQLERIDGMSAKDAARTINEIDDKYEKIPEFKKAVDAASASAMASTDSWLFGDTIKNGADLYGDVALFAKIAISQKKTPEAALMYLQSRFAAMPLLHGSKVSPFVAQSIVVPADSSPDELLQSYLKDNIVDPGNVPVDLMSTSVIYPVEEKGKVVGFKFKMNMANKGYLLGIGSQVAPNGDVRDKNGAPVYLSVDQINKYGADQTTAFGRKVSGRRSTNTPRVMTPLTPMSPDYQRPIKAPTIGGSKSNDDKWSNN